MKNHLLFIPDGNRRFGLIVDNKLHSNYLIHGLEKAYELIIHIADNHKDITDVSLLLATRDNIKREELLDFMEKNIEHAIHLVNSKQKRDQKFFYRQFIGDFSVFSQEVQDKLQQLWKNEVKPNYDLKLHIYFNYDMEKDLEQYFTYKNWKENSLVGQMPNFDIIVRTGQQRRMSDFCTLKISYAEFYFLNELWPALSKEKLDECINDYRIRNCGFGQ